LHLARDQSWKISAPSENVLETYEAVSRWCDPDPT